MEKHRFSVIIANYNGQNYLSDCLFSLFETAHSNFEVIVVEDGSTDSSLEIISYFRKLHPIVLIKNRNNLGLVASRNKAMLRAKGDILVFLDNDTQVDRNWLTGLEETFSKDRQIGAAQCKIFDFEKRNIIQEVGMKIIPYTGWGITIGRGEKDHDQFTKTIEIVSLGAALAVRKEVARKVNGFDEKLVHYTDDLDFSWRVWLSGYRAVLAPTSYVYHHTKLHKSTYKIYFHMCKNSLRMILKNYEFSNTVKFLLYSLLINVMGAVFVLVRRYTIFALAGVFLGIFWNVIFISDTLKERRKVNGYRKVKDNFIFKKIMVKESALSIYKKLYLKNEN